MRRLRNAAGLGVVGCALAAALPVPAGAAWLAKPSIGSVGAGTTQLDADQVVGPDGWTILVYRDSGDSQYPNALKAVRIQPNGRYGTPLLVSPAEAGADGWAPSVSIDGKGNGIIAWAGRAASSYRIRYRRFSGLTARFRLAPSMITPAPLSGSNPDSAQNETPSVALAGDGSATLVWKTGATSRIAAARVDGKDAISADLGTTDAASSLCRTDSPECTDPHVFTAANGVSTVVWSEKLNGDAEPSYRVNQINAFGIRSNSQSAAITDSSNRKEGFTVVQSGNGSLVAAWMWSAGGVPPYRISAKRINTAGVPGDRQDLSSEAVPSNELVSHPQVAVNSSGAAIVTWVKNYKTVNPGPVAVYRRLSSTGTALGAGPNPVRQGVGLDRTAVALAPNGAATLFVGTGNSAVSLLSITPKDGFASGLNMVPPSIGKPAVQGSFYDPDPPEAPLLALGRDGTLAVTWMFLPKSGARQFISQIGSPAPALGKLKFPARFRHGQSKGKVAVTASKYGTAVVTIARAGRQRFRTRVTRIAIPAGASTLTFDTRGLAKGKYTVTVQLIDYAGLAAARSSSLLVTS